MGYISTTGFIMSDFFVRTYSLLISANTASNDASKVKNSPIVVYVHVSDYMDHILPLPTLKIRKYCMGRGRYHSAAK
jgi:hypothetical protein